MTEEEAAVMTYEGSPVPIALGALQAASRRLAEELQLF